MTLTPHQAMGLSFLVPGAAHFALGHALRGIVAFVSAVGLFCAGYALVGERLWAMKLFEPFALLAPLFDLLPISLLPEVLNTGPAIAVSLLRPELDAATERLIRLPREWEHLGLALTGSSGILAALWAADAFFLARRWTGGRVGPGLATVASWLLPGSGHVLLGQKDKGLLLGAAVLAMWLLALWFSAGHACDRSHASAWWIGQSPFGGGVLLAAVTTGPWHLTQVGRFHDLGVVLGTVAGLMNVVVLVDAYTLAEQQARPAGAGAAP